MLYVYWLSPVQCDAGILLARHSGESRNPVSCYLDAGKGSRSFFISWIPAFAGMTNLRQNPAVWFMVLDYNVNRQDGHHGEIRGRCFEILKVV